MVWPTLNCFVCEGLGGTGFCSGALQKWQLIFSLLSLLKICDLLTAIYPGRAAS